jgi:apolipoprotein N-acyltransferase
VSPAETTPEADPYDVKPSFWVTQADYVTAAAVFVFTVLLTVLSFPPYHTPEFAYAFLVPGLFWAYRRPRLKLYAWTMLGAQAVAWTVILGWLHNVTWPGLFLLGPFIGAWIGAWFLAAWYALPRVLGQRTSVRLAVMLGLAGLWCLNEWLRTFVLGGFPWLPLAASQWERVSILQIASFTGQGGVAFVLVMMNLGFAAYAHRLFREGVTGLNKRSQEFFLAVFLLLVALSVHVQETFNRAPFNTPLGRVAFVQPYIPQEIKWDQSKAAGIMQALEQTTLAASATHPDLILWPEAVTPWAVRGDDHVRGFTESLVKRANTSLLLGSIAVEDVGRPAERWFNGAFVVTPDGGLQSSYYAKRKLVPFGEFVPLRPIFGWLKKFVPIGEDFAHGTEAGSLLIAMRGEPIAFGPLICYEDIFPQLARASVRSGADVLVVITNSGWFGEGGAAYQHAAHSVLRAVENRRPVLRCGNGGWSGWIDEFGNVRFNMRDNKESIYFRGARVASITRDSRWIGRQSFYTRHGDWFVLLSLGLVAGAALLLSSRPPAHESR